MTMNLRRFKQNKLWRDKVVENIQKEGSKLHIKKLNDQEFLNELKIKLLEEAHEVYNAKSQKEIIEELADVLEVVDAFCTAHQFKLNDIITIKKKKYQDRGGFEGRNFITIAEHPAGSAYEKYCLNDSEKYPEIKD